MHVRFDSLIRNKITGSAGDLRGEVTLREAVPNTLSVSVIHQCSDGLSDRVTVPHKHSWMVCAALQTADKPLSSY